MMRRQVPARGPAQGKAAHHQSIFVDGIVFPHLSESIKQVGFACEAVAVTVTAIQMDDEGVRRSEFPRRTLTAIDEVQFGQHLAASVKPEVEPETMRGIR